MKSLRIFIVLIASTTWPLLAQTPNGIPEIVKNSNASIPMGAGSYYLGINGTGGWSGGAVSTGHTWSVTGQGGYFVAKRLLAGLQLSYGEHSFTNNLAGTSSMYPGPAWKRRNMYFTPELFSRYYFTSGRVKPFVQLSAGWNFQSGNATYFAGEEARITGNGFTAGAALGLSFRVNRRLNIDLMYNRNIFEKPHLGNFNGLRLGVIFLIGK